METTRSALLSALLDLDGRSYELSAELKGEIRLLQQSLEDNILPRLSLETVPNSRWDGQATELLDDIEHAVEDFQVGMRRSKFGGGLVGKVMGPWLSRIKSQRRLAMAICKFKEHARNLQAQEFPEESAEEAQEFLEEAALSTCASLLDPSGDELLVGACGQVDELVQMLLTGDGRPLDNVVSIVGPAGVGKTALAKAVYNRLQHKFEGCIWVRMSSKPGIITICEEILKLIASADSQGPPQQSFTRDCEIQNCGGVFQALKDKRYFVVFDDVCDIDVWKNIVKDACIGESCVLMTTCNVKIAQHSGGLYTVQPLSDPHSRNLFFRALSLSDKNCPPGLAEISGQILDKCGGIPLFITAAADILRKKAPSDVGSWQRAHHSLDHELLQRPYGIRTRLDRCTSGLSHSVRRCLCYLSMFQKGSTISGQHLAWWWLAENFINENQSIPSEELGEFFFRELISRNLVEAVETDAVGKVLSCRVNNVVHSFIISLSTEDESVTIVDHHEDGHFPDTVRRLSMQGNGYVITRRLQQRVCNMKSLLVSGDASWRSLLHHFHQLRVLHFSESDFMLNRHLWDIDKFYHLKCLVVEGKHINCLPEEMGNLEYLQTLDSRATSLKEFPKTITLLKRLKRLYANSRTKLPDDIGKMQALEELGDIGISKLKLLQEICSLINLRVLRICIWSWDETCNDLSSVFMGLIKMHSLSIMTSCSLHFMDADGAPPSLQNLEISHSTFFILPGRIFSVQSLSSLSIEVYNLSQETVNMLGDLPKLLVLILTSKLAPEGRFEGNTDAFKSLTIFQFASYAIGKIFEPGAMQKLERLTLAFQVSRTMNVSPSFDFGLENLPSLEQLRVEIICFDASLEMVQEAEAAIKSTCCSRRLEIHRVREDMIERGNEVQDTQVEFFNFIQALNLDQRKAIEEVGLGDLLKMKGVKIRHQLCNRLADVYDIKSEAFSIGGSMLQMNIEDVDYLMGLPSKGKEILKAIETDLFSSDKEKITTISYDTLLDYFRNNEHHNEDFIKKVLLYTIGVFICPTNQRYVSSHYLNFVETLEDMKGINWASLTLHHLKVSIIKYKTEGVNLEGNLALLQLWYWEKICVNKCEYTDELARERPLIHYWDEEMACKRDTCSFGEGKIVEDIKGSSEHRRSSRSVDKIDQAGNLLANLMIDKIHLQLKLLNHDSNVKDMLRDIRLDDNKSSMVVQAASKRLECLMKQVLDVGCGPSDTQP